MSSTARTYIAWSSSRLTRTKGTQQARTSCSPTGVESCPWFTRRFHEPPPDRRGPRRRDAVVWVWCLPRSGTAESGPLPGQPAERDHRSLPSRNRVPRAGGRHLPLPQWIVHPDHAREWMDAAGNVAGRPRDGGGPAQDESFGPVPPDAGRQANRAAVTQRRLRAAGIQPLDLLSAVQSRWVCPLLRLRPQRRLQQLPGRPCDICDSNCDLEVIGAVERSAPLYRRRRRPGPSARRAAVHEVLDRRSVDGALANLAAGTAERRWRRADAEGCQLRAAHGFARPEVDCDGVHARSDAVSGARHRNV